MEEIKVRVVEEYRGNVNPERKYCLVDVGTGKAVAWNLKRKEIVSCADAFHLTIVEQK